MVVLLISHKIDLYFYLYLRAYITMEHCLRTRAQYNAFGKALEEYIKGAKECASKLDDDEIRQELAHSPFLSKVDIKILTEELESREEEWSVRGYYWEDEEQIVDDDYFKSFKTEAEARTFYNSITKEHCEAGKVLYKEPYEDEDVLEEENYEEEETVDYDDLQDESICEMVKCMLKNNVNALID